LGTNELPAILGRLLFSSSGAYRFSGSHCTNAGLSHGRRAFDGAGEFWTLANRRTAALDHWPAVGAPTSSAKLLVWHYAKNLTMTTITIEQAGKLRRQEVTLKGWLYNLRESGNCCFRFSDGTELFKGLRAEGESRGLRSLKGLTQESSVIVTGKIRAEKRAPGGFEIGVTKIQIVQKVPEARRFRFS